MRPAIVPAPIVGFRNQDVASSGSAEAHAVAAPRRFMARVATVAPRFVRDPLRVTLFLLTLITVSRAHQHYPFIAALRPALLLMIAAGGIVILAPNSLRGQILTTRPAKLVAAFGILACASAVFGISQGSAVNYITGNFSKTLIYTFLLIAAIRTVADLFTIVYAYVLGCGILVIFAQFVFGLSRSAGSYAARLSDLYTYDANDLGVVLLVGLGFTLWLMPTASRIQKIVLAVIAIGIGATTARTGSRGALLGLITFALALLVLVRSISVTKRIGFIAAMTLALVLGAPPGYWRQMQTMLEPDKDYNMSSTDGRKEILIRGLGYMMDYPAFGVGISNFTKAECSISEKALEHKRGTGIRCVAPHNSYVQAGAELGVPGLIVWLSMIFGGIAGMLKLRRRMPTAWKAGDVEQRFLYNGCTYLAVSLLVFSVTCFFLSFAYMDQIYIMSALMAGLYAAARNRLARERVALQPVPRPKTPEPRLVQGIVLPGA
jgi:O-antigen ligase